MLGAAFLPFLAVSLLLLLNSRRVPDGARSGWLSNALLAGSVALFVAVLVNTVRDLL